MLSADESANGTPPYDPREVANFLLQEAWRAERPLSNLSLNKLIYFCHGWHLAIHGQPLQRECFEAWERGPVLRTVYSEFKTFRFAPITAFAGKLDLMTGERSVLIPQIEPKTAALVKEIFDMYSRLSAWQLVELAHVQGGPWDRAVKQAGGIKRGVRIQDKDIRYFFEKSRSSVA